MPLGDTILYSPPTTVRQDAPAAENGWVRYWQLCRDMTDRHVQAVKDIPNTDDQQMPEPPAAKVWALPRLV